MVSSDQYCYTKERREFGRQCTFTDGDEEIVNEPPNESLYSHYIRRNPTDASTQLSSSVSSHEVSTENKTYRSRGICHTEGGWPKDVNPLDEEQTIRYRRRIERDDQYDIQLKRLTVPMLKTVNQNNAVNIYQQYFAVEATAPQMKSIGIRAINRFVDNIEIKRRASHVNFSPNQADMAISYTMTYYSQNNKNNTSSFIWNIDYSESPVMTLESTTYLTQLEYNSRDEFVIAGGMANGCVCIYDTRANGRVQNESVAELSHSDEVTSLLWIHSKQNTDFFTCSRDGQVMWWDTRALSKPVELLQCDSGCTVLEYQHTMPSKFLIGTDEGSLYYGNRRGTTPEEKLPNKAKCHKSAIRSIERNPVVDKNILTVGGFTFKIWSEDCRDNYVYSSCRQKTALSCGSWNSKRGSLLFIGHVDGTLCLWDFLMELQCSIKTIRPSDVQICDVRCHPGGQLVACCYANGDVFILELTDDLSSIAREERAIVGKFMERDINREKFHMAKVREIKLNISKMTKSDDDPDDKKEGIFDPKKAIDEAESDFIGFT